MNNIEKLQLWYNRQCDGSWEHQHGVSIGTLDNPGWSVVVDLVGTNLESMQMEPIVEEESEQDWIHCNIENGKFVGNGSPLKLNAFFMRSSLLYRQKLNLKPESTVRGDVLYQRVKRASLGGSRRKSIA